MKAPIRRLVEALDCRLHFLPSAEVRRGREHRWLRSDESRDRMQHYGAWVNFWGISCIVATMLVPIVVVLGMATSVQPAHISGVSSLRFLLCLPAVMLGLKFAGDAFMCVIANVVRRFAPGAGCTVAPRVWRFRELREAYAWYCGVPRYWVRRVNRILFLMAGLGVCAACYMA